MAAKTALVIGATGLVGEELVKQLLQNDSYSAVTVLSRKALMVQHPKLNTVIVDFDNLASHQAQIRADHVFSALGSTIKKAGSEEAFRKIDVDIPLNVARIARANGAEKFILISSLGADASSAIFYNRVKGELENELKNLDYKSLIIFRPSILLGDRKESRPGEAIGRYVSEKMAFLFSGPLRKYRGTPVDLLAKRAIEFALKPIEGVRIIENEEILGLQ